MSELISQVYSIKIYHQLYMNNVLFYQNCQAQLIEFGKVYLVHASIKIPSPKIGYIRLDFSQHVTIVLYMSKL